MIRQTMPGSVRQSRRRCRAKPASLDAEEMIFKSIFEGYFAGLVETNHCFFERKLLLRAVSNDSSNDARLSQTVEATLSGQTGKP
jgi:hypothetical protein